MEMMRADVSPGNRDLDANQGPFLALTCLLHKCIGDRIREFVGMAGKDEFSAV